MKKMKRSVSLALVIAMVFCLAACGSSLNDNNTRTAKAVINAVDDYLDGKATAAEIYPITTDAYDALDQTDSNESDRLALQLSIVLINTELLGLKNYNTGDVGKIKDERNNIASLIGESKYKG